MLINKYLPTRKSIVFAFVYAMVFTPMLGITHETEWPGEKLADIFPKAKKFVQRSVVLTTDKIKSIEKDLGTKLRKEDYKPIFYIPIGEDKKPIGLVLFVDVQGPHGVIDGAVGLNMKGKVVKVAVYDHKESETITSEKFLKQFIDKGIDDTFTVGKDVEAVKGQEDASKAVALIPKKTLVMSYALFLKRKPKPEAEEKPMPEEPTEEIPEVEDLKELMILMVDAYYAIVDYFDKREGKEEAVSAAKKLVLYGKAISNFDPPMNADQTEEYTEMQDNFGKMLIEFAEALDKSGITDETREKWDQILTLVNQAHIRFTGEEIDIESY